MKDEWMYDCTVWMIVKNNKYQKEWHNATKPLKIFYLKFWSCPLSGPLSGKIRIRFKKTASRGFQKFFCMALILLCPWFCISFFLTLSDIADISFLTDVNEPEKSDQQRSQDVWLKIMRIQNFISAFLSPLWKNSLERRFFWLVQCAAGTTGQGGSAERFRGSAASQRGQILLYSQSHARRQ